jgi:hypothetical protein
MSRYDFPSDDEDENMLWQGAIEESLRMDTFILLTSEGKRFIASKAILVRERSILVPLSLHSKYLYMLMLQYIPSRLVLTPDRRRRRKCDTS